MPKREARLPPGTYRRGKVIWGRVQIDGREHRSSLRCTDPRQAARALEEWKQQLAQARDGAVGAESWKAAVLRWDDEVLATAVKPAVRRRYMASITMLDPVFGELRLNEITIRKIGDYVGGRSGQVSNATIRRDLTALSRLLSACCAWGWLETNVAQRFDRSILKERHRVFQPPSAEELALLLAHAPRGMANILRLLDQSGMRLNEAVTLGRRDVDHQARTVTLTRTKSSRPRTLPFATPGGDMTAVLAVAVPHLTSQTLFRTKHDGPYVQMSTNFIKTMGEVIFREAAAGREYRRWRIHDLRHGFAIRWLRAGGDIYRLSKHLGHSSVQTTEIYLGYLTEQEQRSLDATGTDVGTPGTVPGAQPVRSRR